MANSRGGIQEDEETTEDKYSAVASPAGGAKIAKRNSIIRRRPNEGLGLKIASDDGTHGVIIAEVVEGGAAAAAGNIKVGDIILNIDGVAADKMSHDEVIKALTAGGDNIAITVAHPDELDKMLRMVTISKRGGAKLGLQVMKEDDSEFHRIVGMAPGSPGATCGVIALGDRLIQINAVTVTGKTHEDVVNLLSAEVVNLWLEADSTPYHESGVSNLLDRRVATIRRDLNGFGIRLKSDSETRGVRVDYVEPGGSADAIGIQSGDVILEVGGVDVLDHKHDEVIELFSKITDSAEIAFQHAAAVSGAVRFVSITKAPDFGIQFVSTNDIPTTEKHYPRISELLKGGAAAKSGKIFFGDRIISVNGINLADRDHDAVATLLGQYETITLELETDETRLEVHTQSTDMRDVVVHRGTGPLGLEISSDMPEINGLIITRVLPGSAAAIAGCVAGEVLAGVNGTETYNKTHDAVVDLLRASGAAVTLSVVRISQVRNVIINPVEGSKLGLVIVARDNATGLGGRIREIIRGTPAYDSFEKNELGKGDVIVAINGNEVLNATHEQIIAFLKAPGQLQLTLELMPTPLPRIGGKDLLHSITRTVKMGKPAGKPLGIKFISDDEVYGHVITSVAPDSIAGRDGRVVPGDVLLSVNGQDVVSIDHDALVDIFIAARDEITFELGELQHVPGAHTITTPRFPGKLGLTIASAGASDGSGVIIASIAPNGNASHTGLRAGNRILAANGVVIINANHQEALSAIMAGDRECATLTVISSQRHQSVFNGTATLSHVPIKTVVLPRGSSASTGVTLVSNLNGFGVRVKSVVSGSAAAAQNMLPGDKILTLDGYQVDAMTHAEILQLLANNSVLVMVLAGDPTPVPAGRIFTLPRLFHAQSHKRIIRKMMEPHGQGLGISIFSDAGEQGVKIGDVDPAGYIAEEGTLQKGDHILQINNIDVSTVDHDDVADVLKTAAEAPSFLLVVSRNDQVGENEVSITINSKPGQKSGIVVFEPPLDTLRIDKGGDPAQRTGMTLLQNETTCIFTAGEVLVGQPAAMCGVREGDEIFAVNDVSLEGVDHGAAVELFGGAGSVFTMVVRHRDAPRGVHVLSVDPGAPGHIAGEIQPGDKIVTIDSTDVSDASTQAVQAMLDNLGASSALTFTRSKAAKPHPSIKRTLTVTRSETGLIGLHFMHAVGESGGNKPGFVVLGTEPESPAAQAGFHDGDHLETVNGEALAGKTYSEVVALLQNAGETMIVAVSQADGIDYAAVLNFRTVSVKSDGKFPRFGLHLTWCKDIGQFRVLSVYPDSPASRLGHAVRIGDRVTKINGVVCAKKGDIGALDTLNEADIDLQADVSRFPLNNIVESAFIRTRGCMLKRSEETGFGLTLQTSEGVSGVAIQSIAEGSAAKKSGALAPGDVIYQLNKSFALDRSHDDVVAMLSLMTVVDIRVVPADEFRTLHIASLVKEQGTNLGLSVASDNKGQHRINDIKPASSAYYCENIRYGDAVLAVNGIDAATLSHDELTSMLSNYDMITFVLRSDESDLPQHEDLLHKGSIRWEEDGHRYTVKNDVVGRGRLTSCTVYKEIGVTGVRFKTINPATAACSPSLAPHDVILEVGHQSVVGWTAKAVQLKLNSYGAGNKKKHNISVLVAPASIFDREHMDLREIVITKEPGESYGLVVESKSKALLVDGNAAAKKSFADLDHVGCRVTEVRADGALARTNASIYAGDDIIKVNGIFTNELLHEQVTEMFKKPELRIEVRSNHLPLFPEDDVVTGTTRTVTLTNEGAGFGMVLIEGPPTQVSDIRPGTPAYNCNQIFENDILVRINGNLVADKSHAEIIHIISESQTISFTLESNETAPPKADARMHKEIAFTKGGGSLGLKIESMDHGGACIRGCVPGTPAALTDIQVGDEIVMVNGVDFTHADHNAIVEAIQGAPTEFTLTVRPEPVRLATLERGPTGLGLNIVSIGPTGVAIKDVTAGSVADTNGRIFPSDVILSINGANATKMTHEQAIEAFQGSMIVKLALRKGEELDDDEVEEVGAENGDESVDEAMKTTSFSRPAGMASPGETSA